MSVAECSVDIAIPFLQDSRLRREFTFVGVWFSGCVHRCLLGFDRKRDQLSCIFRKIRGVREDHCDRLADIAHGILRQHRLAIGIELLQSG